MEFKFMSAKEARSQSAKNAQFDENNFKYFLFKNITNSIEEAISEGECNVGINLDLLNEDFFGYNIHYSNPIHQFTCKAFFDVLKIFKGKGYNISNEDGITVIYW